MSKSSESNFDLELHFLPAWAQKDSKSNPYSDYAGDTRRDDRGSGDRGFRRDRPPRRDGERRGPGPGRGPGGGAGFQPGGRPDGGPARRGGPPRRDGRRPGPGGERGERGPRRDERPDAPPLPEIVVTFKPDETIVDALARQIKATGRAYPLFDIAQMILQKPERHGVILEVKKKPDGAVIQPLYTCALDESVWLSEDETMRDVLDKFFTTFYQPEQVKIDPPKGTYTFVAQCGMSGEILGPPNYHDYQNRLHRLHADRFSRMPFEMYKARVKIVRDEAVVKKWLEEQSFKTEYTCLNLPEPLKLQSREDVEKHFRQTHLPNVVRSAERVTLTGTASRGVRQRDLQRLIRVHWEAQKHFPLQVATLLSQQFASRGLHFFKVNKTLTHVAVARPHYLDLEATPVSESVKRIVDFIQAKPKCTTKQLLEALAPASTTSASAPVPSVVSVPASDTVAAGGDTVASAEPTATVTPPEQAALLADLRWLVMQGHVIEYANGTMEMAKKPPPRPAPRVAPPTAAAASAVAAGTVAEVDLSTESAPTLPEASSPTLAGDTSGSAASAVGDASTPAPESP